MAKQTRRVECSSTNSDVPYKQFPEVSLQLYTLPDNSVCPVKCKLMPQETMEEKRSLPSSFLPQGLEDTLLRNTRVNILAQVQKIFHNVFLTFSACKFKD